jgi:hypothetical protein
VTLTPETEIQTVTLPVQADPSVKSVFITGSIPARELSVVLEAAQEASVTGKVPVPVSKAEGIVTFRNLTEEPVSIPAGTVLTSTGLPGVRFLTVEDGELEAGLEATLDLPVEAGNPGVAGNVEAEAIQAIEGDLGLLSTASNAEPTSGGRDRLADAATENDLARLREDLLAELETQALSTMETMLESGDQIFADTLSLEQVLAETFDPPLGQPGNTVRLSMRVEFTASYASGDDLSELASTVLNASKPEGFADTGMPLNFEVLDSYRTNSQGVIRWTIRVSRQLERQIDTGKVIPLVQGHSMAVASAQLKEALKTSNSPEIQLTPAWWPWLPLIPFNITVETR